MSRKSLSRKSMSRKSAAGRKSVARKSIAKGAGAKGSPKGSKDGSVRKKKEFDVPDPWVRDLEPKIVCDDSWRCITAQLNEFHANHVGLVDLLNKKSERGDRWPVQIISMDVIKERVLNNCAKGIEWQPYNALCEKIKETAGRNFENPIPAELLAPMIKYIILQFKELDRDRSFAIDFHYRQDKENYKEFEKTVEKTPVIDRGDSLALSGKAKGSKGSGGSRKSMKGGKSAVGRKSSAGRKSKTGRKSSAGGKRMSAAGRKSSAGKRKSAAGGPRKSAAGRKSAVGRKSAAGSRKSMARKSVASGRKSISKGTGSKPAVPYKKKMSQLSLDVESDLNRRERPPMDIQYKEDHPLDGPDAYFVLTQMRDPDLPKKLLQYGVPYSAAIVLNEAPPFKEPILPSNKRVVQEQFMNDVTNEYFERIRDHRKKPDYSRQLEKEEESLQNFWRKFIPFANSPEQAEIFKNTIESIYQPRMSRIDLESPTAREEMKELLYDDVSKLMFMIHRLQTLYEKYVGDASVLDLSDKHMPEEQETFVYFAIMDALPPESHGVPMVLDAILTQVEFNTDISLAFDPDRYGWILGAPPDPILKTKLDDHIPRLHKEYDLFRDEDEAKTLKAIFNPRSVVFGDSIKWRTLHLGKLGRFIRDREENMLKVFVQAQAFGSAPAPADELGVHQFHRPQFGQTLGIREQNEITESVLGAANLALIGKNHEWFADSHGEYYFTVNGPIPADDEGYDASKRMLIGEPPCTEEECASMTRLLENFSTPKMAKYLNELNHFTELRVPVLLQRLYSAITNSDVVEKDYIPFPDVGLFKTYNCAATIQKRGELPTVISFREYFKHVMNKNKRTMEDLLEIAERDRPFIFKSQIGRLMSDAELYKTATVISEDLTVDDTHFVEPYSYIEEHLKDKPHEITKEEVPKPKPYEGGKPRFYDLPNIQTAFNETKKSFIFENGTRVNLNYDDTILSRHKIEIKVTYDKHNLIYRTPLYSNYRRGDVLMVLENGIVLKFTETNRSRTVKPKQPVETPVEKPAEEPAEESEEEKPPENLPAVWVPSKAKSMEWECLKFPEKFMGQWDGMMVPVGYNPTEGEEEKVVEDVEEKEIPETDVIKEKRIEAIMRAKKKEVCENLVSQFGVCTKFGTTTKARKALAFSPFDRKSLDSTMNYDTPLPYSEFELQLSWPTGLHIRLMKSGRGNNSVSYIKQKYLSSRKDFVLIGDELYRCVASDGTVIRFLKGGHEVLYPSGTKVFFEKFENPPNDEEVDKGEEVEEAADSPIKPAATPKREKRKSRSASRSSVSSEAPMKAEDIEKLAQIHKESMAFAEIDDVTKSKYVKNSLLSAVPEGIKPETYILSSEGNHRHVIPGRVNELIKTEKMIDFEDFFCNVRMTTRSDGTKFIFRDDGERIVRYPDGTEIRTEAWMNKTEFFVPWTLQELFTWFEYDPKWLAEEKKEEPDNEPQSDEKSLSPKPSRRTSQKSIHRRRSKASSIVSFEIFEDPDPPEESPESLYQEYLLQEEEGEGRKRIKLEEDGFVVVSIAFTVYHPHFAAVRCGCKSQEVFTLFMPGEVTINAHTGKGEFTVQVGNPSEKTEMKLKQQKCIFDNYSNGKLLQRACINLQCFRATMASPPITLFSFVDSNASELTVDADGNIYTRIARNSDPCENIRSRTSDFRSFVVRRDLSGVELFPSSRMDRLKKLALGNGDNKLKVSKRALLNRSLIMQTTNSVSGYWAMKYPPHNRKCVFKLPSTYGKDWMFPFRKRKSKKPKLPQFVVVDVINNVESKFEMSSIVKSMLEAYHMSLLEGQVKGCQCGAQRTKSTAHFYKEDLDFLVRNVVKGRKPCKCQLLSALGSIVGREDASLCRYYYNKKEPSSLTKEKCDSVDNWINTKLVPHVVRMATKKHELAHKFGTMRSYLKAFSSVKVPNYFESPGGVAFSILEELLNRVHHVAKEIHRWETLDEILDIPVNEVSDDQIWDLVLCINPTEEGLGNSTQEQFLKQLQSARALNGFFPTMRAALDYRRNLIKEESMDEDSELFEANGMETEQTRSKSTTTFVSRSSVPENVKRVPSWCQSKDHSIKGCSCVSMATADDEIKTYHTHLGPPLSRKEFFGPIQNESSWIQQKTAPSRDESQEFYDVEEDAEEGKPDEAKAWEKGEGTNANPTSNNTIQKLIELILTAPPKWGGEDAWMNEMEKCEMAVLRAAKEDRKESWVQKMEDFKKPVFPRKEVDQIMRDMLEKMGDHIKKLNI